jgi:hydrogenase small subunit
VDGGIPTAFDGHTCVLWTENGHEVTALEAVRALVPKAAVTLCIGTCSSFGGIPSANPNPTGLKSVSGVTGASTINIPGCPVHPDWIVWTIASLLAGVTPTLDAYARPVAIFGDPEKVIHKNCPRKGKEEAKTFGEEGRCLKELGCKGPRTRADCFSRMWNNHVNWCIGANAVCLGCTEQGFPDRFSPLFKAAF